MPIKPISEVKLKTEEEFREMDYRVMGVAFEIHNQLGPYFDELVYKNELAFRLTEIGLPAAREFEVELSFRDYSKKVFVDLFIDSGIVYEVKTATSFAPVHRSQALNYLFVTGTKHGKLVNFRGAKVAGEFVSSSLGLEDRQGALVQDVGWDSCDSTGQCWRNLVTELIADWGSGLDLSWYRDAVSELTGGLSCTETEMAIVFNGRTLGTHRIRLLAPATMWTLTAVKEHALMKENCADFSVLRA